MKNKITLLAIFLAIVAVTMQGITIYISNTSAADSISATSLSAKIEKIEEDNINLESKILTLASFNAVASRAAELGYVSSREFVSAYDPVQVAILR